MKKSCHDPLPVVSFPAAPESQSSRGDLAMVMASIIKTVNNLPISTYSTARQLVDNCFENQSLRKRHGMFY